MIYVCALYVCAPLIAWWEDKVRDIYGDRWAAAARKVRVDTTKHITGIDFKLF